MANSSKHELDAPHPGPGEEDSAHGERRPHTLEKAHANLAALLENTDDYILFSDCDGTPLFFNSAYKKLMRKMLGIEMRPGIKPHEMLPDPEVRAMWDGFHRRVLAGERFRVEIDQPTPGGEVRHFEVSYNPVLEAGRIIGFSEFARDITERKRAELAVREARDRLEQEVAARTEELRASESRFRGLTERSEDVIVIADDQGVCRYISPSVNRYGFDGSQLVGRPLKELAHPDDQAKIADALERASRAPGRVVELEAVRGRSADDRHFVFDGTVAAHFDVRGIDGIVLNMRDVTERLELESRLRQAEKMDAIGQLAGGVAHDFNNQLTAILANADLLVSQLSDAEQKGHAEQIARAALRSADLTRKLLAFARKGQYRSELVDLGKLLADVAQLLGRSIDKRITIELELGRGPLLMRGDATLLQNALLNLGINARDAMPEGGTLHFSVRRAQPNAKLPEPGAVADDYLSIVVADDGIGMDADTQHHIFEPFFTTKPPGKGTGMGLASVYGTVRSHGGHITVTSSPGAGARFEILLPGARPEPRADPAHQAHRQARALHVLVVDDEPSVRAVLKKLLEAMGHTALTCNDGVEAVEQYRKSGNDIDLVVLDMVMPRQGGRETFFALRELNPDVRVLISSGFTVEGGAQELLDAGAVGFVQKPIAFESLARALESSLN